MTRAYIRLTRAESLKPGDGVFMYEETPVRRGPRKMKWISFRVESVTPFGADRVILSLILRLPERGDLHYSRIVEKTKYMPRLLAWIREPEL